MNRRTAVTTALVLPALTGCYYSQYFDVTWDEEVKLHDGSAIVVNLDFTCRDSGFKVNASAGNLTSVVLGEFLQRDVLDSHAYTRANPEAVQRFKDFWTTGLEQATSRGFNWVRYGPAANDSAFDIRTTARVAA